MSSEASDSVTARSRRYACEQIADSAATLLRSRFGNPGAIEDKGNPDLWYDVVTEVDVLAEQLVLRQIHDLAPNALVLAEEGGMTAADGTRVDADPTTVDELWIVDPLDGTINFAHGIPHFAVSVACWRAGRPVAGAIRDPMVGETFSFEREADGTSGAFHDGTPMHVIDPGGADNALVYVGSSASRIPELVGSFRGVRQLASAALALAWVGAGRCGAYVQLGALNSWDWAVGVPLIEAAGGIVTDGGGSEWHAPLTTTTGIIAGAPSVHADVVRVLESR